MYFQGVISTLAIHKVSAGLFAEMGTKLTTPKDQARA